MRTTLATVWMYCVLAALTVAALVLVPLWMLVGRLLGRSAADQVRRGIWVYGRACTLAARPFVPIVMDNPAAIRHDRPTIIVANHQSFFDTYLLGAQDAENVCMLIRSWPFKRLFFFRPLMRLASYIETEVGGAEDILARCRAELEAGNHIMGFPEGTRSPNGELGRFHSGMFKLAVDTGTPVVPLVIHGSHKVLPKGSAWFRPGKIRVEALPPVNPADFLPERIPHLALRRRVRAMFMDCLAAETGGGA